MVLDNADFISVVHNVVGSSKECINKLSEFNEKTEDEDLKALIVSAASLLTIHNSLLVQLAEENSVILDKATKLLETLTNNNLVERKRKLDEAAKRIEPLINKEKDGPV